VRCRQATTCSFPALDSSCGSLGSTTHIGVTRREMSLVHSGHLVKIDISSRGGLGLTHGRTLDRGIANRIHDRLAIANGTYASKVLRSYKQDEDGCLSSEQVRSVLDRLRTGLTEEEKDRWVDSTASE
jgi:hypothetical protein